VGHVLVCASTRFIDIFYEMILEMLVVNKLLVDIFFSSKWLLGTI
jgi:hypothetical protein